MPDASDRIHDANTELQNEAEKAGAVRTRAWMQGPGDGAVPDGRAAASYLATPSPAPSGAGPAGEDERSGSFAFRADTGTIGFNGFDALRFHTDRHYQQSLMGGSGRLRMNPDMGLESASIRLIVRPPEAPWDPDSGLPYRAKLAFSVKCTGTDGREFEAMAETGAEIPWPTDGMNSFATAAGEIGMQAVAFPKKGMTLEQYADHNNIPRRQTDLGALFAPEAALGNRPLPVLGDESAGQQIRDARFTKADGRSLTVRRILRLGKDENGEALPDRFEVLMAPHPQSGLPVQRKAYANGQPIESPEDLEALIGTLAMSPKRLARLRARPLARLAHRARRNRGITIWQLPPEDIRTLHTLAEAVRREPRESENSHTSGHWRIQRPIDAMRNKLWAKMLPALEGVLRDEIVIQPTLEGFTKGLARALSGRQIESAARAATGAFENGEGRCALPGRQDRDHSENILRRRHTLREIIVHHLASPSTNPSDRIYNPHNRTYWGMLVCAVLRARNYKAGQRLLPARNADLADIGGEWQLAKVLENGRVQTALEMHQAMERGEFEPETADIASRTILDNPAFSLADMTRLSTAAGHNGHSLPFAEPARTGLIAAGAESPMTGHYMTLRAGIGTEGARNHEDANLVSESAAKKLAVRGRRILRVRESEHDPATLQYTPHVPGEAETAHLDEQGIVRPGTQIRRGMVLCGRQVTGRGGTPLDASVRATPGMKGIVTKVHRDGRTLTLEIEGTFEMQPGDKLASHTGMKGIACIVPDHEMPCTADGQPLEIVLSPLNVMSRMAAPYVAWAEIPLGNAAEKARARLAEADLPIEERRRILGAFHPESALEGKNEAELRELPANFVRLPEGAGPDEIQDLLSRMGYEEGSDLQVVYKNQRALEKGRARPTPMAIGPVQFCRPDQIAGHKLRAFPHEGVPTPPFGAPMEGIRVGSRSLKLAEGLRTGPAGSAMAKALRRAQDAWQSIADARNLMEGREIAEPAPDELDGPEELLQRLVQGFGLKLAPHGGMLPMSDAEIRAASSGELRLLGASEEPEAPGAHLCSDSLEDPRIFGNAKDPQRCACGIEGQPGSQCRACGVTRMDEIEQTARQAHIELPVPALHPFALTESPGNSPWGRRPMICALLGALPHELQETGRSVVSAIGRRTAFVDGIRQMQVYRRMQLYPENEALCGAHRIEAELQAIEADPEAALRESETVLARARKSGNLDERTESMLTARNEAIHTLQAMKEHLPPDEFEAAKPSSFVIRTLAVPSPAQRLRYEPLHLTDRFDSPLTTTCHDLMAACRNLRTAQAAARAGGEGQMGQPAETPKSAIGRMNQSLQKFFLGEERGWQGAAAAITTKDGLLAKASHRYRIGGTAWAVISPGPELQIGQVSIPHDMAWVLYEPFGVRALRKGQPELAVEDAKKIWKERGPAAQGALQAALQERHLLVTRNPNLHVHSTHCLEPVLNRNPEDPSVHLEPMMCEGMNADFDGDAVSLLCFLPEWADREARQQLSPRNRPELLLKQGTGEPIFNIRQEALTGLSRFYQRHGPQGVWGFLEEHVRPKSPEALAVHRAVFEAGNAHGADKKGVGRLMKTLIQAEIKHRDGSGLRAIEALRNLGFSWSTEESATLDRSSLSLIAAMFKERRGQLPAFADASRIGPDTGPDAVEAIVQQSALRSQAADQMIRDLASDPKPWLPHGETGQNAYALMRDVGSGARVKPLQFYRTFLERGHCWWPDGRIARHAARKALIEGISPQDLWNTMPGHIGSIMSNGLGMPKPGYVFNLISILTATSKLGLDCGSPAILPVPMDRMSIGLFAQAPVADPENPGRNLIEAGHAITARAIEKVEKRVSAGHPVPEVEVRTPFGCANGAAECCTSCYGAHPLNTEPDPKKSAFKPSRWLDPHGNTAAESTGEFAGQAALGAFHGGGVAQGDWLQGPEGRLHAFHGDAGRQIRFLKGQGDSDLEAVTAKAVEWADERLAGREPEPGNMSRGQHEARILRRNALAMHQIARAAWAFEPGQVHPTYLRTVIRHLLTPDPKDGLKASVMTALAEQNPRGYAMISKSWGPALRAMMAPVQILAHRYAARRERQHLEKTGGLHA